MNGKYEKSIEANNRILSLAATIKNRPAQAEALFQLGKAYQGLNLPSKAAEQYERSWPVFQALKNDSATVRTLFALMHLYATNKQPKLAIARGENAAKYVEQSVGSYMDPNVSFEELEQYEHLHRPVLVTLLTENGRAKDAATLPQWDSNPIR